MLRIKSQKTLFSRFVVLTKNGPQTCSFDDGGSKQCVLFVHVYFAIMIVFQQLASQQCLLFGILGNENHVPCDRTGRDVQVCIQGLVKRLTDLLASQCCNQTFMCGFLRD